MAEESKSKANGKSLDEIRQMYASASKNYKLPELDELRKDFDIDRSVDCEPEFLIKEIRRIMGEKFSAYLHLFETLVNPSSPPMFVFSFMKNLSEPNKKQIKEIYKEISRMQINSIKLDTIYSDKAEAEHVLNSFVKWKELRTKIYALVEVFQKEFENNNQEKEKSYFG
jgi:hypothetical protein